MKTLKIYNPLIAQIASESNCFTAPAEEYAAELLEKIDGIVAWIMALDRCIRHEMQGSVYDEPDHDLIVL